MNKAELIEHIAGAHTLTKAEAGRIVETLTSAIVNAVKKGGSVVIPGFGSFKQVAGQRAPVSTPQPEVAPLV
jgi:DNA-binding protein HU-beta